MDNRYEFRGSGIWDRLRRCWVVWVGIGGNIHTTDDFKAVMMAAINGDAACATFSVPGESHEYVARDDGYGCVVCGEGVGHYAHREGS